jgi:anti-sigma-K factor RskA
MGDTDQPDAARPADADAIADLLPAYALGVLGEDERAQVEAYLRADERGRRELAALEAVVGQLPLLVDEREPPAGLRQRLLAAAEVEADAAGPAAPPAPTPRPAVTAAPAPRPAEPTPLPRRFRPAVLAAGLLLFLSLGLGAWNIALRGQVDAQQRLNDQLQGQLAAQTGQNSQLLSQVQQQQAQIAALQAQPRATIYTISGTPDAPNASGQLVYLPGQQTAFLSVQNLPAAPQGRTYQVWYVPPGQQPRPIDAGLLGTTDPNEAARLQGDLGQFQAVAVSLEPAGGSQQPTGPIVLLAPLRSGNA